MKGNDFGFTPIPVSGGCSGYMRFQKKDVKGFSLDFSLDQFEVARTREFFDRLDKDGVRFFSSDNFRAYGLDRLWTDDEKLHMIGVLFAKLKANRFIVQRGEVPSDIETNHKRKNDLCERTGRFEKWLVEQQRLVLEGEEHGEEKAAPAQS
jgi:hypothetical protein